MALVEQPVERLWDAATKMSWSGYDPGDRRDWTDANKADLADDIRDFAERNGYNGDDNFDSIYWFIHGISLGQRRRNAQVRDIPNLPRFRQEEPEQPEPQEQPQQEEPTTYEEWREQNGDDEQRRIVDEIMERLETNPESWEVNFDQLNNTGRSLLFPRLNQFFDDYINNLDMTRHYTFRFRVGNKWSSKPFTPELYQQLRRNFTRENLLFDMEREVEDQYSVVTGMRSFSLFSAIALRREGAGARANQRQTRGGGFFQYLLRENVPKVVVEHLKRYQIFDTLLTENKQRPELNDCCLIYALKQYGISKEVLTQMRTRIYNRYQTQSSFDELCQEHRINLTLHYLDDDAESKSRKVESRKNGKRRLYLGVPKAEAEYTLEMNIYKDHYFLEEKTPFSFWYIQHFNDEGVTEERHNWRMEGGRWRRERYFMRASKLVRWLFQNGYFKPITYAEYGVIKTVFHTEVKKNMEFSLEYNEKYCTKLIEPRNTHEKDPSHYWFCDFETDTSGNVHTPFLVVLQSLNGRINKEFRGESCGQKLLEFLPDNSVIYFHNLAYDIRMIAKHGLKKTLIKGQRVMRAEIDYFGKNLMFRDTLPILSCKLSAIPKMFAMKDIQKEIFPYKYYTLERLERNVGVISEAGNNEDKPWSESDYELFRENIDKIGCRTGEDTFDMWRYASFYCQQDVRILRLGFTEFRKGFVKDFKIDPFKFISISSLANEVFNRNVYYPNRNLFKVGGHLRVFLSRAVYGGRCMCAYNKKWHVKERLYDYDAVSLYPSAMSRLYTVEGRPKVIQPEQLNMEFLSQQSAYVVEVKITKANKHYPFPLIVQKVDGLNLNDDNLTEPVIMVVDNIYLEDLIEFQQIEFDLIKGYYWDGKRDYRIQEVIKHIFNKRLEYKNIGNPLQNLYKLVMNSCYGKTIEQPVDKSYIYIPEGPELDAFWQKNYNKIIEDVVLDGCNIHAIKILKPINQHFNFSLLGIQVLSMSKRIMNEVMCLAYDIGCRIYYQDTDSMHISASDLSRLEKAFQEKYQRELRGKNMGQFHTDFTSDSGREDVQCAVESIFLMKKMYIDQLLMSDGTLETMTRGKGLTLNSINYLAKECFDGNKMLLYRAMFRGETQTFDLTKGEPRFAMNKDMSISNIDEFKRTISVKYEEGKINEY